MKSRNLTTSPPIRLSGDCQTFAELLLGNLGNPAIRSSRQWANFRADDEEAGLGFAGKTPLRLGMDCVIPPVPSGLCLRRPRFWLELPPAGATPKRPRDSASEDSDTINDLPVPKRLATWDSSLREDILPHFGGSATSADVPRYSSDESLTNPLRGCPDPIVLYGMDADSALLKDPVFSKRYDLGLDSEGAFARGQDGPATLVLKAVGAERVSNETVFMRTWRVPRDALDVVFPFALDVCHSHICAIPEQRVADGSAFHCWAFGARLGPWAVGTSSNQVQGVAQPKLSPSLRKINYRELLMILEAPRQAGLPCSINTDAPLG